LCKKIESINNKNNIEKEAEKSKGNMKKGGEMPAS